MLQNQSVDQWSDGVGRMSSQLCKISTKLMCVYSVIVFVLLLLYPIEQESRTSQESSPRTQESCPSFRGLCASVASVPPWLPCVPFSSVFFFPATSVLLLPCSELLPACKVKSKSSHEVLPCFRGFRASVVCSLFVFACQITFEGIDLFKKR
jgi:hypothetical protein